MSALAAVVKRDRLIIGAGVTLIAALAWWYLIHEARRMNASGVYECLGTKMGGAELTAWSFVSLLPLFLMWAVMMVAMMLPSAAPMILTFAAVARNRRRLQRPYVPVTIFVSGYLVIWCGFSAVAALSQWLLHRQALLSPAMASSSALLGGALLFAAGLFQFTPLKQSCLTHCRAPLEFILTRWREGRRGAFRMGLEHGAFCTGCCWALMCLLFVLGVMNIVWIAALTIVVAVEKILPRGRWVSIGCGLGLAAWGAWVLANGFRGLQPT
jgi:predicted metal-binding membrane protein